MAETYSVIAQLSAVDKNFTSVFGKADKATQTLGQRIRSGIGFGALMSIGQKAMSTISGSIDSAISRVDTLNNFPKVMESMGYSTKAVTNALKTMDKGIDGLPTTMDGITKSTQMLTASLGNVEKGSKSAVALNDMFLAGGQGAEAASRALTQYNQMLAKGKVDQQSWNSLVEVAPGQMNQLAKSMLGAGKNQKDLYKALQDGKISMSEFNDAIIKLDQEGGKGFASFAEQARASTKGIGTSIQNIKTSVVKGMANVITATDQALADNGLLGFAGLFDKAKDSINKAFGSIKDGTGIVGRIPALVSKVASTVRNMWNAFKDTGAVQAVKTAAANLGKAFKKVASSLSGSGGTLTSIADLVGNIVTMLANAASAAAKFISKLPKGVIDGIAKAILVAVASFAAFRTGLHAVVVTADKFSKAKSLFTGFKKGVTGGVKAATSGTSKIAQVINSLGSLINSAGKGIAAAAKGIGEGVGSVFKGIGSGISTAFQGIGKGLAMVSPVTLLALGAAIALVCASLTLLATQGKGVATIVTAIGTALGTLAATVIGAFAQAIVTVAGVVPVICQGLSLLAPLVVALGQAVGAAAPGITALGNAISKVITAVGGVVAKVMPTITDAFTKIVPVVSRAITSIIAAVRPIMPFIQNVVATVAPVVMKLADSFVKVVQQIRPTLDALRRMVDTCFKGISDTVTSIGDAISKVVQTIGDSISGVLDSVAGIFDSIGNAALNAGKGFDLLSKGVKRLVNLRLGDLVATLKETAGGISDIAKNSTGLPELGDGFSKLGKGIQKAAMFGTMAGTAFRLIVTALTPMQTAIEGLPAAMTVCAAALQSFSGSVLKLGVGLMASVVSFMAFGRTVQQLVASMSALTAVEAIATMVMRVIAAQTNKATGTMNKLGSGANKLGGTFNKMAAMTGNSGAAFSRLSVVGAASMAKLAAAIRRAGSQSTQAIKSMATQMVSAATAGLARMSVVGGTSMTKFASGIRSKAGAAKTAAKSAATGAATAARGGYSGAYSAGKYIGQGLASGITAMKSRVSSAAASLAKSANRSITVTAKIHSPSKVTDKLGRFYGEGFAQGIEEKVKRVAKVARELVSIPDLAPDLALAGGNMTLDSSVQYGSFGDLKADILDALQQRPIIVQPSVEIDGRQVAKTTAVYMQDEQNKLQARENRKMGVL